jgi:hypothetical protein
VRWVSSPAHYWFLTVTFALIVAGGAIAIAFALLLPSFWT